MAYQAWVFNHATGAKTAYLENAIIGDRKKKANTTPTISLTIPADDPKAILYLTSAYDLKIYNTVKARWEDVFLLDDVTERWDGSGYVMGANYSGVMIQLVNEGNITYDSGATPLTPTQIITALLTLQQQTPAITVGTIEPTLSLSFAVENTNLLTAILEYVTKGPGGYVEVDADLHFNWYAEPSGNPVREIRYQKNMKGVTRKKDFTQIWNRVYAYGFGEPDNTQVTLIDAGEAHEYIQDTTSQTAYGVKTKRITDKRIIHPATLLRWAQLFLASYKDPIFTYTVDAVNLAEHSAFDYDYENLEVGQIIRVVNSDMNNLSVNVKLVSVSVNLSDPKDITVELANTTKDLADSFSDVNQYQDIAQNVAVQIGAGQVTVLGTLTVEGWRDDWRSPGSTTIAGGKITANSITVNQLNFTPILGTTVIASINASAEGIQISGARIAISGSTTFDSGYDPTSKTAKVGGTYDSAASGARVRIFPDANTGILITDGTNDVFKALVGGTDVGDVIIGDYAGGNGAKWDKSAGTFTVAGKLAATSIASGSTLTVVGAMQSTNYSASSPYPGWLLNGSGDATFHDITINGAVVNIRETLDCASTITGNVVTSNTVLKLPYTQSDGGVGNMSIWTNNGTDLYFKGSDGYNRKLTP